MIKAYGIGHRLLLYFLKITCLIQKRRDSMDITITLLSLKDEAELFEFEKKNRQFFEMLVPGRGDDFYQFETFQIRHRNLLKEQEISESFFYLIKDERGNILGRVNLFDINPTNRSAEIGFRVGLEYCSKGIASEALKLLLESHSDLTLKAKTTINNLGSQKVLERAEFKVVAVDENSFEMNGQKLRFIHYIR